MIPKIETDRLLLIPPSAESFEVYERFYTSEQASKMYGGPITSGEAWARLKADLGAWYLSGFGVWVIQEKDGSNLIGTCGFWQGKGWPRELTWWLLPEARGRGVASEASLAAISHAYKVFGWSEVETYMNDENAPARTLVGRLGGIKTRRDKFPDGLKRDVYTIPEPA